MKPSDDTTGSNGKAGRLAEFRGVLFHAALAAVCLGVLAWAGADAPADENPGARTLFRCTDLHELRYQNGDRSVVLTTEDARVWVDLEVGAPRDRGPHGTSGSPAPLRAVRLRGNEQAHAMVSDFELVAIREIDSMDDAAAASVGLGGSDHATLRLSCDGAEHALDIGIGAFGSRSRYARYDGKLVLIDGAVLNDLEVAEMRLVERRLLMVSRADAVRAEVEVGGETLQLAQLERRTTRARWVDPEAPETRRRDYERLMRAVFGLSVEGMLSEGVRAPVPEGGEPVCDVRVYGVRDALLGEVSVRRVPGGETGSRWVGSGDQREPTALLPTSGANLARAVDRIGDVGSPH